MLVCNRKMRSVRSCGPGHSGDCLPSPCYSVFVFLKPYEVEDFAGTLAAHYVIPKWFWPVAVQDFSYVIAVLYPKNIVLDCHCRIPKPVVTNLLRRSLWFTDL